jgi:hypothetical protein
MKSKELGLSNLLIIIIVVAILLVGGYFYLNYRGTGPGITGQKSGGTVFNSIQDALSRSISLQCEYPDNKGGKVTVYIKNGAVRVMGYSAGQYGQALMKDNKMYVWDDKTKQGVVMSFNMQEMMKANGAAGQPTGTVPNQGEDFLKSLEQYKNYCKPATVGGSVFNVPSDVKFVDFEQQMKNSGVDVQQMMQQYQQQAPAGQ